MPTRTHSYSAYVNYKCRCAVCRKAWAAYMLIARARRVSRGVCVECKQPPANGWVRCAKHHAAALAANRARYAAKHLEKAR